MAPQSPALDAVRTQRVRHTLRRVFVVFVPLRRVASVARQAEPGGACGARLPAWAAPSVSTAVRARSAATTDRPEFPEPRRSAFLELARLKWKWRKPHETQPSSPRVGRRDRWATPWPCGRRHAMTRRDAASICSPRWPSHQRGQVASRRLSDRTAATAAKGTTTPASSAGPCRSGVPPLHRRGLRGDGPRPDRCARLKRKQRKPLEPQPSSPRVGRRDRWATPRLSLPAARG